MEKSRSTSCDTCAEGRTSKPGSTICSSCPAGRRIDGNTCKACLRGTFTETIDAEECLRCTIGTTTASDNNPKGEGASTCNQCDLGRYGSKTGVCSDCPTGYYQDGKGELLCKACPVDTFSTKPKMFSKADCTVCHTVKTHTTTDGQVARRSNTACICRGKFLNDTINPDGFYTDTLGKCIACPPGADCHRNGMKASDLVAKVSLSHIYCFSRDTKLFTHTFFFPLFSSSSSSSLYHN